MRKILIASIISVAAISNAGLALAAGSAGARSVGQSAAPANSNGLKSTDRDFGKERAADRRASHNKGSQKASLNTNGRKAVSKLKGEQRSTARQQRAPQHTARK